MTQEAEAQKQLLRVTAIATQMNVSERAVQKWITQGLKGKKLSATRAGTTGMWRIHPDDLETFLTSSGR